MLTLDSTVQDLLDMIHAQSGCADAAGWVRETDTSEKFSVLIERFLSDDAATEGDAWVVWLFENYYQELSQDVTELLLQKISDPMQCLILRRWCKTFLSKRDSKLLHQKYAGKLPCAESEEGLDGDSD